MITNADLKSIRAELRVIQAHNEAFGQSIQKIIPKLSKLEGIIKTDVGARAIAEHEARILRDKNKNT